MKTLLSKPQQQKSTPHQVCGNCTHARWISGPETCRCDHPSIPVSIGTGRNRVPCVIRNIWETCDKHTPRPVA